MGIDEMIRWVREYYESVKTRYEKDQIEGFFLTRAKKMGKLELKQMEKQFSVIHAEEAKQKAEEERERTLAAHPEYWSRYLTKDTEGAIQCTLDNYKTIMEYDPYYAGLKMNEMKNAPEKHSAMPDKAVILPWEDADEDRSLQYIEKTYGIYSDQKHYRALRMLFEERTYNPVKDIVGRLEWDGTERIPHFLHTWMKCDDTPYTREVSRLIFAGGINRLYEPGCKFDEVPVLIGSKQGEGKSTVIKWLALNDKYESDVTQFEGQQAIEQLEGAWICEIAELLALTKVREQEAAKAFITRSADKYRRPWGKNTSELPRRCVFIGTTNNRRFLRDRTGNRRFYPVEVHSVGYDLFAHERECRDYIEQCWAEARVKYLAGEMPPYADRSLLDEYIAAQTEAMEDDWRVGAIESYLERKDVGDKVCVRELAREALALNSDDFPRDPTKKESGEIGEIMDTFPDWKRLRYSYRSRQYGNQRGWEKINVPTEPSAEYSEESAKEPLPFKI